MRHLALTSAFGLAAVLGIPAHAEDAALLLGNPRYEELGRVARAADVVEAADALRALGFGVDALQNGRAATTGEALGAFLGRVEGADRLVVAMAGRFATDGTRTWFLTAEAAAPRYFTVAQTAVSVESVLEVLGRSGAQAVLLLGAEDERGSFDPWLRAGIGALDVPQGVTVLRGGPRQIADFLEDELARPESDLAALVARNNAITAEGYMPRRLVFMPPMPATPLRPVAAAPVDTAAEDALWEGAVALDSIEAYRNYLARYPSGRHAEAAEEAIGDIVSEPQRDARLAEDALGLSREQRRAIQRNLTLLDHPTRGIDGIFGPGTRAAVSAWQQTNGLAQSSYLTADQITRLDAQAARRSAQLEAEAERRQQEEARQDRAFWQETGARGDEVGYRAYLDRYPDGLFAQEATANLNAIEAEKRALAEAEDRAAWDATRGEDTEAAYRRYLRDWPGGVFQAEAEARIAALTEAETGGSAAAAAEEQALGINPLTARLVEQRLDALGLAPGTVDGRIDDDTRRALRRFQRDRDLPATGYLNEATVVRLLAESIGSILR